jgi:hypothetical protein
VYGAAINLNVGNGIVSEDDFSTLTAPASPPSLQSSRLGDQFVLSWPRSALHYVLEECADLDTGIWIAAGPPVLINNLNVFRSDLSPGRRFYRLMRP